MFFKKKSTDRLLSVLDIQNDVSATSPDSVCNQWTKDSRSATTWFACLC